MMDANKPNDWIGFTSETRFAAKAAAVVKDVTKMARQALLNAKVILLFSLLAITDGRNAVWRQASQKTKMSSAAIPSTIKMVS